MLYLIVTVIILLLMSLGLLATVRPGQKWLIYPFVATGTVLMCVLLYLLLHVPAAV